MTKDKARREAAVRRLVRQRLLRPIVEFTHAQASSGIVLMAFAVIALVWANSPWAASYFHLWETPVGFSFGEHGITKDLHHWINDGLMAVFFLLVGLEIKREVLVGELSTPRQAGLPIAAAIGGMVVPAGIYVAFNYGQPTIKGWGVPMATDIAFSLGVLALLGSRAPLALKVFLTAFAIVDDLGAVLVIAFFYTSKIDMLGIQIALGAFAALVALNYFGVRKLYGYVLIGLVLWYGLLLSGVHATLAGVLLALTIPARVRLNAQEFLGKGRELLSEFDDSGDLGTEVVLSERRQGSLRAIEQACEEVQMPLQRMEHSLHGWVNLMIMPIFALANAGVALGGMSFGSLLQPVTIGTFLGLVIGKPVGVVLMAWLAVKTGFAQLPRGVTWLQITGAGVLGGIGFTMALFIGSLAFKDPDLLDGSKLGILLASITCGLVGGFLLSRQRRVPVEE